MAAARRRRGRPAGRPRGATVKSRKRPADNPASDVLGGVGLAQIRQLIRLVRRTGIGELEISAEGRTVRISAYSGGTGVPAAGNPALAIGTTGPLPARGADSGPGAVNAPAADRRVAITSPMVGTFFRAPAPDAEPYVEVGDTVEVGQTVCIVEAMKLMNEIESDVAGRVVQVLVENQQPVEFGQKLFLVEPA